MITFDQVCFRYKQRKPIFEKLSLSLTPGHIYGLLGKNGEGKSTLLRITAGLLFPNKGQINVWEFTPAKREAEFLQQIFYLPEEPYLPSGTIKNYAKTYGVLYPNFKLEQFEEAMAQFGIVGEGQLDSLSYGQRKKAAIAFALACNTSVLLLDEPTNGLDIPSKIQFRKLILSAFDEDRVIIIATHQVRDLENLIDSVIIVNQNKLALQASTDDIEQLLSFHTCSELTPDAEALYAQTVPSGYKVVTRNVGGLDSQLDLEYLFNAVIENPIRIQQIFDQLPAEGDHLKSN
ncbi:ABC transporter ATP-binding protein [Spirosoma fluviale]|uniref:ABC-2 type transport system ATP-binding protein n=1 Tax=Spirosoma fluviale TaxID=1597977 RepID=A0A286G9S8_9BACT|nr:ABC transporter ATP-binding protein [Spirosoma fluviale]SOD92268.1 ABC-2 type transport system ATP-binding protein [Spirosoma fluviale]